MLRLNIIGHLIGLLLVERSLGDFRAHPNWPKHVEGICGESYNDRIIGGRTAKIGQFPWMARALFKFKNNETLTVNCGASLISDRFVLTAAHCIEGDVNNEELKAVVLGEFDDRTNPDCDGDICADPIQIINVESVVVPEKYQITSQVDDILLIKLAKPAKFTGWVLPICLPTGHEKFGNFAEIAGWGFTRPDRDPSEILKFVKVPIVDMKKCRKHYRWFATNGKKQICAGTSKKNEDSCTGDSGGPLMQVGNSDHGPRYYLNGIVSYGHNNCGRAPAVYTRVSAYMQFILDAMET